MIDLLWLVFWLVVLAIWAGAVVGKAQRMRDERARPGTVIIRSEQMGGGMGGQAWVVVDSAAYFGISVVGGGGGISTVGGGGGVAGPGRIEDMYATGASFPNPGANLRAEALLKEWLSPEQLVQYEQKSYFDVVGCDTGRRYRITDRGPNYNVFEIPSKQADWLDRFCFGPGGTPQGDIMLAQKIALENFEDKALLVANRTSDIAMLFTALFPESV